MGEKGFRQLAMFGAVSKDVQREDHSAPTRVLLGLAVGEDARQIDHLGDPTAIVLVLHLDGKMQGHHLDPA